MLIGAPTARTKHGLKPLEAGRSIWSRTLRAWNLCNIASVESRAYGVEAPGALPWWTVR